MTYKTIAVHLIDDSRTEALIEAAVTLSTRFGAHLIGVHVAADISHVPAFRDGSTVIDSIKEHQRQSRDAIQTAFARATAGRGLSSELRLLESQPRRDPASLLLGVARATDLVVVNQPKSIWEVPSPLDDPERLALVCGRPVLMIPRAGARRDMNSHALVAWKNTREAARAVFDALPLLQASRRVTVLKLAEHQMEAGDVPVSRIDIAAALERHGVKTDVVVAAAARRDTGAQILASAEDAGADLLVMGAYGHTRMTEYMFGGATRHVARHMTLPTLFSH